MLDLTLRELLDRYGPTLAVVAALALLVALVPASTDGDEQVSVGATDDFPDVQEGLGTAPGDATERSDGSSGSGSFGGGGADDASGGSTGDGGSGQPTRAEGTWGPGTFPPADPSECRSDGRQPGFAAGGPYYQPVCVPEFTGDNGGETSAPGVTADTIKVIRFLGNTDPVTEAALRAAGGDDPEDTRRRVDEALVHYYNNHVETYGREVVVETFQGTGGTDDDAEARADAATLADKGVFAVFPAAPTGINAPVLAEELAARGVMCMCTSTEGREYYDRVDPYVWSTLPAAEDYYETFADYWAKRLAGREAIHAGNTVPPIDTSRRKFGLIYLEGSGDRVDADAAAAVDYFEDILADRGIELAKRIGYTLDLARGQEQAINIMAQMKDAGVTTMACFCDPLTPVFFYEEATRSAYFPENFITGSILMDTTFFSRTYDQGQMEHAFGVSPLWVFFQNVSTSTGYRSYHHADLDAVPGDEGVQINVRNSPINLLFLGIHNAGPELTPQNFKLGMVRSGQIGGTVKAPLVFFTERSRQAIKDFTEVWYNSQGTGEDETGKFGRGILMKSNQGVRYQAGGWPQVPQPTVFGDDPDPVFTSDDPPETFPHDADGHDHGSFDDPDHQACRSCRRTSDRI